MAVAVCGSFPCNTQRAEGCPERGRRQAAARWRRQPLPVACAAEQTRTSQIKGHCRAIHRCKARTVSTLLDGGTAASGRQDYCPITCDRTCRRCVLESGGAGAMQSPGVERASAAEHSPPQLQAERVFASDRPHPPHKPHPPLNMEQSESAGASKVQQLFEAELGSGPRPPPDELRASRATCRCAPPPPPAAVARAAGPLLSCAPAVLLAARRCCCSSAAHREREELRFKVVAGRSLDYQAVPWAGERSGSWVVVTRSSLLNSADAGTFHCLNARTHQLQQLWF